MTTSPYAPICPPKSVLDRCETLTNNATGWAMKLVADPFVFWTNGLEVAVTDTKDIYSVLCTYREVPPSNDVFRATVAGVLALPQFDPDRKHDEG